MQHTVRTSGPATRTTTSPINTPAACAASRLLDRIEVDRQNAGGRLSTFQRLQKMAAETLVPAYGKRGQR